MKKTRAYGRTDFGKQDILNSIKNIAQKKTLTRWINEKLANGHTLRSSVAKLYSLRKLAEKFNKPFEKITRQDIVKFLSKKENQKLHYKTTLKEFLRWLNNGETPASIKWVSTKKSVDDTAEERDAMTEEELKALISSAHFQRDRAIFSILSDTAPMRPKDITNTKCGDVVWDKYGCILKVRSKTPAGRRQIRLIKSLPEFKVYWNQHPWKDDTDAPLFFSLSRRDYGRGIGWNCLHGALQKALKIARKKCPSLKKKKINLYSFRYTITTNLLQDPQFTPKEIQTLGGWSSIQMLDRYSRVTSQMVSDKILQINGKKGKKKKQAEILKVRICPRCGEENGCTIEICNKCFLPLTQRKAEELKQYEEFARKIENNLAKQKKAVDVRHFITEMVKLEIDKALRRSLR